jgi:hypothetical protein
LLSLDRGLTLEGEEASPPSRKSKLSSPDESTRPIANSRMEMTRSQEFPAGRGPVTGREDSVEDKADTGSTKRLGR